MLSPVAAASLAAAFSMAAFSAHGANGRDGVPSRGFVEVSLVRLGGSLGGEALDAAPRPAPFPSLFSCAALAAGRDGALFGGAPFGLAAAAPTGGQTQ